MARLANQMKQLYAMCATALVMGRADLDGADDVGFDIENHHKQPHRFYT